MLPNSQYLKVSRPEGTYFPWHRGKQAHPGDQTLEMYKDSVGKISVGREEAMVEIIFISRYPLPTRTLYFSHNEAKCIISPKDTFEEYTCSPLSPMM